jgi:hypothetical protein
MNIHRHTLGIAVTKEEHDQVEARAKAAGLSVSDYLYRGLIKRGFIADSGDDATKLQIVPAVVPALTPETTRPEEHAANKPGQETMPTERTFDNVPAWTKGPRIL